MADIRSMRATHVVAEQARGKAAALTSIVSPETAGAGKWGRRAAASRCRT